MPQEQKQQNSPLTPKQEDSNGPKDLSKSVPDTKSILKKLKEVDRDQSRRYKSRSGQ